MNTRQFDARFFTTIPNALLNMVQAGTLKPRDLFTYAYLKDVIGPKLYTLQPVEAMSADLDESPSSVKESLSRLVTAGIIRRQRTIRNTKTFILVKLKTRKERVAEAVERRRIPQPARAEIMVPGLATFSDAE